MSYKKSYDDPENVHDNETDMELNQKSRQEHAPVSVETRSMTKRELEMRPPPGPACSKARPRSRSRSGSVRNTSPRASSAAAAITAGRKSRREAARNANRFAVLADSEGGDEQQSPIIIIDSDESEEGSNNMERAKPPLKRRMDKEEGGEPSSSEETKGKRGRPRTTGLYVARGDAIERENTLKKKALELDIEKSIRNLSASEVLSRHKPAMEDKLEELENAPTEDVAQQARQSMVEVWKVATTSKNLKGGYVKMLKQAAAVGSAAAEVLSIRADNSEPDDNNALRQIKALRRELERTKREVQTAKDEAERTKKEMERLRKELEETRGSRGARRGVRAVIDDSPPPSPFPPSQPIRGTTTRRRPSPPRWKWRWMIPLRARRPLRTGKQSPPRWTRTPLNTATSGGKQKSCRHGISGRRWSALRYGAK